jgi:hypothetical protein
MATRIEKEPEVVHQKTRVLLTIENGQVISSVPVRDDEFIGTTATFASLLKKAGYVVSTPHPAMND